MAEKMKVDDFIKQLKLAQESPTIYAFGGFGASSNFSRNKTKYAERTPFNYNRIMNAPDGTFFFDCVCLVKGVLWGFNAIPTELYGGADYCSNDVPDYSISNIKKSLVTDSTDFTNIERGEFLYLGDAHCGIYIGDNLAIESTSSWNDGVQISQVANIIALSTGYPKRRWDGHGKLPWVEYGEPKHKVIDEDGMWGKNTTYYLQLMLGTKPDGIISGQPFYNKKYCVNCYSVSWEFVKKDPCGSDVIYALQQYVGMSPDDWDRWCGYKTILAIQMYLHSEGLYDKEIDGYMGEYTVLGIQKMINRYFQEQAIYT